MSDRRAVPLSRRRRCDYNAHAVKLASNQKYLIVNADDFGFSRGITEGIIQAHREGIVTSTTIVANMPFAAQAAGMLKDLPTIGVGVHLNVSQGKPLSPKAEALCGPTGVMSRSAMGTILAALARPALLEAIETEFDAQIRWALDHGIRPTHLDTHRHVHGYWPICRRLVKMARRYNIAFIRRHRERLPGAGWPAFAPRQKCVSWMLNMLGSVNNALYADMQPTGGTWGLSHTGRIDVAFLTRAAAAAPVGLTEIMTHPGMAGDEDSSLTRLGQSRQVELASLCDERVKEALKLNNVRLVHYGQL